MGPEAAASKEPPKERAPQVDFCGVVDEDVRLRRVGLREVWSQAAGILFTADPVTSNRKVASIEAGFGLGETLVSGLVNADGYKVRDGQVIEKALATK